MDSQRQHQANRVDIESESQSGVTGAVSMPAEARVRVGAEPPSEPRVPVGSTDNPSRQTICFIKSRRLAESEPGVTGAGSLLAEAREGVGTKNLPVGTTVMPEHVSSNPEAPPERI